ncbi:MAG: CoB--CoM heterodisulfide reductase iron-sulfur subunit B family protein [Candidatus Hodarchaeales archaeon]
MSRLKMLYYPGCTMKASTSNGLGFEESAIAATEELGVELVEMEKWYCCNTVYSMASDDLIRQVAPIRNLVKVQKTGEDKVVSLCSMCTNTLIMANSIVNNEPDKLETINAFMDTEPEYKGEVEVLHLLQVLRDEVGMDKIKKAIKKPLKGLTLSPYYGCVLTRPKEAAIDDPVHPTLMRELLEALGAVVIEDPYQMECCGSYHTVANKEIVADRTYQIVESSKKRGADALVLTCPLCQFNLDSRQVETKELYRNFTRMPVLYFTQLLAIALGIDPAVCHFENHEVNPLPLLESKGLVKIKKITN